MTLLPSAPPPRHAASTRTDAALCARPAPSLSHRHLIGAIGISLTLVAFLLHHTGLHLALATPGGVAVIGALATLALIGWRLRGAVSRRGRIGRDISRWFAACVFISLSGAVASYPVAAMSHGFVDAALQRADEAMGFDWLAWYQVTAAFPALQIAGRVAYAFVYLMPAIILTRFAVLGHQQAALRFLLSVWLAAWLTLAVFVFVPAIGPFAYLWHGSIPYMPSSELWQPSVIPALREHRMTTIDPTALVGLVSFPSFHTAAATVLAIAAWPDRKLRAIILPLDAAMLLSIPVEGTHYLSDMISGAAIALAAVMLVRAFERRAAQRTKTPAALSATLARARA